MNILKLILLSMLLQGCNCLNEIATEDRGCVPVYIGTGIDEEGNMTTFETAEVGCPNE